VSYIQEGTARGCALPQSRTAGCSTAREEQHGAVRYCERDTALRSALLPERHSTAQCATAKHLSNYAHCWPSPFLIRVYMHGELPPQGGALRWISFTDRKSKGPHLGLIFPWEVGARKGAKDTSQADGTARILWLKYRSYR